MRRTILLIPILSLAFLASGCATSAYPPGPPGHGEGPGVSVAASFFWDELAPYGDWTRVEPYGWVWAPWDKPGAWRPYTLGRWVATSYGWTWVSDWPWGWAPFHYGRWTWHPGSGWIWIPGRVWAPAWVAWRHGPGWVGWAPLPPGAEWRAGSGLQAGDLDLRPEGWVFVAERDFPASQPTRQAVPVDRNPEILRETRDVTRYEPEGGRVAVRSVPVEELERTVGRPVPRFDLRDVGEPPPATESVQDDRVRVYRPEPARRQPSRRPPTQEPRKAVPKKPPP